MADPRFDSPVTPAFGLTDIGLRAKPTFADIDGDGDLDAFVGSQSGTVTYFRNTGTAAAPSFVSQSGNFGLTSVGPSASPTFADIDGDGDLDAFVGAYDGTTRFFRNTGTAAAPAFVLQASNFGLGDVGFNASPTLVDIDGDGDRDAFVGANDGTTRFFPEHRHGGGASLRPAGRQLRSDQCRPVRQPDLRRPRRGRRSRCAGGQRRRRDDLFPEHRHGGGAELRGRGR